MMPYRKLPPEYAQGTDIPLSRKSTQKVLGVVNLYRHRPLATNVLIVTFIAVALLLTVTAFWLLAKVTKEMESESKYPDNVFNVLDQSMTPDHMIPPKCTSIPEKQRFDCYPESNVVVTQELCENRNCCFMKVPSSSSSKSGVPWCFYPPDFPSYSMDALNITEEGYIGKLSRKQKSYYPKDIETLQLNAIFETDTRLHIKITDFSSARYEVPVEVPHPTKRASAPTYQIAFTEKPFSVTVMRKSSGTVLINTAVAPLFFADQFLQISTTLPSQFVYGLGEHRAGFAHSLNWNTLTFWARDVPPTESTNLYGVHPFYLVMEEDGKSHGVFLLNSNPMDVVLQPAPALTWRTIGGIFDLYVFLGPDPNSVIQQYLEVIGFPAMPPFWGLGFHLCRWGYGSSNATWEVVSSMRKYEIPQDVQWNDIEYMHESRDFSLDPEKFNTLPELVQDLHKHGQRYVMILDPGISSSQPSGSYWPFDEGLKRSVFINTTDDKLLIGKVWPGLTAFPDFSDPETHHWWYENLEQFYSKIAFDGAWIDMNEPSSFLDGSLDGCPVNELENPPYLPGVLGGSLRSKTICASAKQRASLHYNLHSLYGLMEAQATFTALKKILKKRPFVISRSTYPSQGRYSGHWLGDNRSQWKEMYWSVSGTLNFNMFGIPLVGADICGFSESTTEELCLRWMQLGAFYPFSRNHNSIQEKAQDPTAFSSETREAMKKVLLTRYALLPYLYTLFHRAHQKGYTVARPLFFEFPQDSTTYLIDRQFLWGRSLLVTPVLEQGATSVVGYFPKGIWYNYYTGSSFISSGESVQLAAPLDHINLHVREGSIIPTQKPGTTTWVSSGNNMRIIATLSSDATAYGDLFWDDGDSIDTYETGEYSYLVFNVSQKTFTSSVLHLNVEATYITIDTLTVFGVQEEPTKTAVNGNEVPFSYSESKVLTVENLQLNLSKEFVMRWQ
ncbi:lysosomal alpha-glucosidase-like [Protopterus annectens]|uniref:lysosomal alpha-glucosidase-like n=1 Tax=Protopterus annectens TaxID=7888 RepID=UPI001CF9A324|nr:lysosomal alpha-glucosidase-like [Protopterus annectens]